LCDSDPEAVQVNVAVGRKRKLQALAAEESGSTNGVKKGAAALMEGRHWVDGVSKALTRCSTVDGYLKSMLEVAVVHFVPSRPYDRLYLPDGASTATGVDGLSIEMNSGSTLEKVIHTLAAHLEMVEHPLSLYVWPVGENGAGDMVVQRYSKYELSVPSHKLSKLLTPRYNCSRTNIIKFQVLPFRLDEMDFHGMLLVGVFLADKALRESYWRIAKESAAVKKALAEAQQPQEAEGSPPSSATGGSSPPPPETQLDLLEEQMIRSQVYVLMKKESTVGDVLEALKKRIGVASTVPVRLLGVKSCELDQQFSLSGAAATLNTTRPPLPVKHHSNTGMYLELIEADEQKALAGELEAGVEWMPLQVSLYVARVSYPGWSTQGTPLVTYVTSTDELEDIIERAANRRQEMDSGTLSKCKAALLLGQSPHYLNKQAAADAEGGEGGSGSDGHDCHKSTSWLWRELLNAFGRAIQGTSECSKPHAVLGFEQAHASRGAGS
ncbi:unnamed protein product, partial [Chrysoparadoxa australica]